MTDERTRSSSLLVTGCAGFIGFHVCRMLLEQGEAVVGVDNLNDAYDVRLKQWRLERLEPSPNFIFHRLDISNYQMVRSLFLDNADGGICRFRGVINLGARAGVRQSVEDPWAYYQVNAIGTLNLLELCREFEVKKFVLASTSSVYGNDTPRPFREDSDSSRPLSPYAASKKAAEGLVYSYHYLHGLDVTVLRYFTVYGPAGRPDLSVFIFIRGIFEGEPLTVFGDGKQDRDFTYVDDIARGTIAALRPLGFEIINMGGDQPVTISDVIGIIENCVERESVVNYGPLHPADVRSTWADINRARSLLDWEPLVSIEEGIQLTVDWYKANRSWVKDIP